MAITAASLLVRVGAETRGAETALGKVGGLFKGLAIAAPLAAAAVGIASLKMAGDFQAGTTTLVTGAGESIKNLQQVRDGILKLAVDTGTSTKQLTDGMFMIESAGFHGAAGLKVLQAAAEGAKVGNADLGVVADATTTILTDFGKSGINANQAVNALIATVSSGKTHMEDLAGAMAQILPTAAAAHIGLSDVMGAMATMTGEGVPAANAATYLRQTILALIAPSKQTTKALAEVGLTTTDVASAMQDSMPDALKMITDAVGKKFPEGSAQYVAALKQIAGGSKQMQGLLDLTGDHLKTFGANMLNVGQKVHFGKDAINGWALVQQTFNFQMERAKEVVETLGIKIGTLLLPYATALAKWVADNLTPAFNGFLQVISPVRDTASQVADKLGWLKDAAKRLATPFDDGSRAIGKLYSVVHPLKDTFDEGAAAAKRVVDAIKPVAKPFDEGSAAIARLGNNVKPTQSILSNLADFFTKTVVPAVQSLWKTFQTQMLPELVKFGNFVKTNVLPVLENLAKWFLTKVVPAAQQLEIWFLKHVLPVLEQVWKIIATDVIPAAEKIADTIMTQFVPAVEKLWNKLSPVLLPVLKAIGDTLKNVVGPAISGVIGFISKMIDVVATIIGKVTDFFNLLGQVKDKVGSAFGNLNNIPVIGGLLPHFAEGGTMQQTGMALVGEEGPELVRLPGGAQVSPVPASSRGGGGGLPAGMNATYGLATATADGHPTQLNVYLDGYKVAQIVTRHQPNVIRNGTGARSF